MTRRHKPVGRQLTQRFHAASVPAIAEREPMPCPFSLRLTVEERAALEREAGRQPLGAYIRSKLLHNSEAPRRARRTPLADDKALAQLLGELGRARLANNLNQLAKAVHTGSLPVTPDTENAILTACQDVQLMRETLIAALGLGRGGPA
jgi:hypothetical protein